MWMLTRWLTNRLRKLLDYKLDGQCESVHIDMDKDEYKKGVWIQVGNYILRNLDGSVTKHGSTFKSKSRSIFYNKVLDRLSDARLNNTVTQITLSINYITEICIRRFYNA